MVALGNTIDLRSSFLHFRLLFLSFFWLVPPLIEDGQKKDTEKLPFVCLVDHRAADIDKSSCCSLRHTDSGKAAEASSAWWPSRTQTRILPIVAIPVVVVVTLLLVSLKSLHLCCLCFSVSQNHNCAGLYLIVATPVPKAAVKWTKVVAWQ